MFCTTPFGLSFHLGLTFWRLLFVFLHCCFYVLSLVKTESFHNSQAGESNCLLILFFRCIHLNVKKVNELLMRLEITHQCFEWDSKSVEYWVPARTRFLTTILVYYKILSFILIKWKYKNFLFKITITKVCRSR